MPTTWVTHGLLPLLLFGIVFCSPDDQTAPLRRRQHRGVVHGVGTRDENGNVYLRREVRDLHENHTDQWNLYMLALEKLHWVNQDDPYSYFGLASIHGRPYRIWENAPGLSHKIGSTGYCPHSNQLFLGWHRPYLALYEQVIHQHMLEVAYTASSDQIDRYIAAAESFRMPYWDWSMGDREIPWFFMEETISVMQPNGVRTMIWNPLYTFRFQEIPRDEFDDKFRYVDHTIRWPNSSDPSAESHQDRMQQSYADQSPSIVAEMGLIFRSTSFARFASRLEEPHGWIHGVIGGNWNQERSMQGHFWPLEYAAFEPLFMLHHANVDRLMAIYQAAHPERWMEPTSVGTHGNVFLEDHDVVDANTALLPFRKASGSFWTSNDCRDHTVFGYTYPELQRWRYASDSEYQSAVRRYIAQYYSGGVRGLFAAQQQAATNAHSLLTVNRTFVDWTIETAVIASAVPPTFVVQFFFVSGQRKTNVGTWMKLMPSDTTHGAHQKPVDTRAMAKEQDMSGTVSLTAQLVQRFGHGLASLEPKDVVPFLFDHLTWEVRSGDGRVLPADQVAAFTFEVYSTRAHIPEDDMQAVEYEEPLLAHPEATKGKVGGVAG
ncbi:hypothetical protein ACN47E_009118 [Coniothyrium glycines]